MLEVDIDKILPVTEARDNFNKIIDEVEGTDHMYVLTKNGKPSAVVVGVNHLEKLTGKTADELTSIVEKKADETPVVEEVNSPTSQSASGSKPPEVGSSATGQSIQPGMSNQPNAPIDVPIETGGSVSPPGPQGGPLESGPAPTSSPGSAPVASVASNQAPSSAPTENGAPPSDSDLFV